MSSLPLITALGALQAVPTIIALAQGAKDGGTKAVLVTGAIVSTVLAVAPYVDAIRDLLSGDLVKALAVACGVLGVLTLVRVPNRVIGTLATVAGALAALTALDIVG
jgi:hypothetical protein